jgi:Uma2 family endonuclease
MVSTATVLRQHATWDDLLDVPEGFKGEIIDGVVMMSPRPAAPHLEAASVLGAIILNRFQLGEGGPGGWVILDEPYIAFGADIRIPDLAGWKRDRYRAPEQGPYAVMPDWVCEVLSPSTVKMDRGAKLDLYLAHGIGHVWLLDPLARTLEIYQLHEAANANQEAPDRHWLRLATFTESAPVRAAPFDAVALDLALLWGPDEPVDGSTANPANPAASPDDAAGADAPGEPEPPPA